MLAGTCLSPRLQTAKICAVKKPLVGRAGAKVVVAASKPLHHIAPDGFSSAWVLPNVPQQYTQLRSALSGLQQQLDRLLAGSSSDRLEASLATAALCILVKRAWWREPAALQPAAAVNAARAARFVSRATERAAQQLLLVANSNNSRPDIDWGAFPACLQQQLLALFTARGCVSLMGFPVLQQQQPYDQPMDTQVYHTFIERHPHYMAHWEEHFWEDLITPTPAQHPWLHPLQLQQALTEEQLLSLSAHIPAFQSVLQHAVAARILPEPLLLQAQQAASKPPLSTAELFIRHWVQQAGAALTAGASGFITHSLNLPLWQSVSRARLSTTRVQRAETVRHNKATPAGGSSGSSSVSSRARAAAGACVEDLGDGSGGRCFGAITAVGSGDEGSRPKLQLPLLPYGDGQQPADLAGPSCPEMVPDADKHWASAGFSPRAGHSDW